MAFPIMMIILWLMTSKIFMPLDSFLGARYRKSLSVVYNNLDKSVKKKKGLGKGLQRSGQT